MFSWLLAERLLLKRRRISGESGAMSGVFGTAEECVRAPRKSLGVDRRKFSDSGSKWAE